MPIEPDVFPWFPYRGFTFSLGLHDGGAAWTSGQSAIVYDEEIGRLVVTGSMTEQTQMSYLKLLAVLEAQGLGPMDVVHITENVTARGIDFYDDAERVRKLIFGSDMPTVTTVIVDRLVRGNALIEIDLHGMPGGGKRLDGPTFGESLASPIREGHDGTIHVPTLLPIDSEGRVVHAGDPKAQYEYCLQTAEALFADTDLGMSHMVSCHEYITPTAFRQISELGTIRASTIGTETVGGSVVMSRLHRPGIEISLDITLSRSPKVIIDPGWGKFSGRPLVPALAVGKTLYLSAIAASDRESSAVVGVDDLAVQAREVYGQILELLSLAGLGPEALRSTIEFCVADRIGEYRSVSGVRQDLLSPPWPASTGELCTGFSQDGVLLQTTAIAHLAT